MVGVELSNGRAYCQACHNKIKKDEKRFYVDDSYMGRYVPKYYHPKCYWDTHREGVKAMICVFLPFAVGEDFARTVRVVMGFMP